MAANNQLESPLPSWLMTKPDISIFDIRNNSFGMIDVRLDCIGLDWIGLDWIARCWNDEYSISQSQPQSHTMTTNDQQIVLFLIGAATLEISLALHVVRDLSSLDSIDSIGSIDSIDWIGLDCGMRHWDRLTECINDTCGPNTTTGQCFVCPPPSMPEPQSTFIAIIMTSPNMCTHKRETERERLIESNRIDKDVRLKSSSLQPMVDIGTRTTDGSSIPIHATGLE